MLKQYLMVLYFHEQFQLSEAFINPLIKILNPLILNLGLQKELVVMYYHYNYLL